jgi:hypothetical protein
VRDFIRWPVIVLASCLAVTVMLVADVHGPLRLAATLWFMFVCTGMAFAPLLEIRPRAFELALGVVFSIVLDTLVALALLLADGLTAASGLIALAILCLVGCGLQLLVLPLKGGGRARPAGTAISAAHPGS